MLLFKAANSRRIRARTLHSRTEDARMRSVRRVIAQAARRVALLKTVARAACAVGVLLGSTPSSEAQGFDLTLFVGRAFPTYDERLTLRPPKPTLPGIDTSVVGSPLIKADGGLVFGGALALEFGILGIEGRVDATDVALELTGAQYNFRGTEPPFDGFHASVAVSDGRFDADRIPILSFNGRVRTPGPVALVASGGLSYLPDITLRGSIPLHVEGPGIPELPVSDLVLTLRAVPGESKHRWGVNGGAGLRVGRRVALVGEVRVFYFPEYELHFASENGGEILDELIGGLSPVRFKPIFVNAQAGVTFRF
jgi:hypothetical protein